MKPDSRAGVQQLEALPLLQMRKEAWQDDQKVRIENHSFESRSMKPFEIFLKAIYEFLSQLSC